jgi:hypothetical protein
MFAVMMAAILLASGVALAVSKSGGNGDDVIEGTPFRDTLSGGGGDDRIYGKGRRDRLYGDSGADKVFGNTGPDQLFTGQGVDRVFGDGGDDFLNTLDERIDTVIDCGAGVGDEAYVDLDEVDNVAPNCEGVVAANIEFGPNSSILEIIGQLTPRQLASEPGVELTRIR